MVLLSFLLLCPAINHAAEESPANERLPVDQQLTREEQNYLQSLPVLNVPLILHQPPLSYIENGKASGYLNALFEILAKRLNLKFNRTTEYSFAESIAALQNNQVSLLNDYSTFGADRHSIVFTKPVISMPFVAVGRSNEQTTISSMTYLHDKVLVLVSGFQQTKTIQQRFPEIKTILVDNIDQAYRALRNKQADYYIDNATHAGYYLASQIVSDLEIAGELPASEMGLLELSFAVRKDQPLLFSAIQKALNAMDKREIQAIRNQWVINQTRSSDLLLTETQKKWLASHPQIRLASDRDWLPFENIDRNEQYEGIAADYMKLIQQRLGIKFITSPSRPWKEITNLVKNRQLDLFTLAMETEPRKKYAIFTKPYVIHPMIIVTRENVGFVDGLKGLSGKSIAIENGYASYDLLSKNHPELKLQTYPDSISAVLAVSRGQAFAYIGNIASLSYILRTHGITNVKISGQVPYNFELAMGVRSDWPELVPILQKALDSITLEEKNQILKHWIGIDLKQKFDYSLIWKISAFSLLLFAVIIYWNILLKKKVRQRTAQLLHQAHYDALTELPNRLLALDRLSQLIKEARRYRNKVALLFLDLDDFKKINDSLGHDAGDKILIDAANRLRNTLREGDTVARLGGDEFVIMFGEVNTAKDACPVAENLIQKFREAFNYDGRDLLLTASVGIAMYPDDGVIASDLLRNADSAMYHSKQQGRNTYYFFDSSMTEKVTRRLLLEEKMSNALDNNEFSLKFQPKINIKNNQITGAEALLRWYNPELGEISPVEFIPIAEQNGMIIPIGQFVLENALQMCNRCLQKFGDPFQVAVNMSPRQFRDPELVKHFTQIIRQSGVPANSLELEITEGVLMSGHNIVADALTALKSLDVSLAMDDFGTGYSSLSYLRKYPFDVLKIDREFIKDITIDESDLELVNATIDMAHALGIKVVAEGVETEQQLSLLHVRGCDLAQGYLFSKPLSALAFNEMMEDSRLLMAIKQHS